MTKDQKVIRGKIGLHLARPFGGVRPLEFDLETLLAAEPSRHL